MESVAKVPCKWCHRLIKKPPEGEPRLCGRCRKRGHRPKRRDALDFRLPGSFESGKRR